jgi:polysaccharide pyruvyl transferase
VITAPTLEQSQELLLASLDSTDITFCRLRGNMGDFLIDAGAERLLEGIVHRTVWRADLPGLSGETLIVGGSGAWCSYWYGAIAQVMQASSGFDRIVVFPSTFDVSDPAICDLVGATKATLYAREWVSEAGLRSIGADVVLAHDTAFFFDFGPFRRKGRGILRAFRTDPERAPANVLVVPEIGSSIDISARCSTLDEWLGRIAEVREVHTDRAHVMIAAALLGKRVRYRPCAYFKVNALAQWLGDYDVAPL